MKKKKLLGIVLSIIFGVAITCGSFGLGYAVRGIGYEKDIDTINYILSMYRKYYYEESDNVVELFESSLLDIYSNYYTKEEYDLIKKASQGSHEGIGVTYDVNTNTIISTNWNSPADRAGITSGGVVVGYKALEESTYTAVSATDSLSDIIQSFSANTKFNLQLNYSGELREFEVAREEYTQTFVRYYTPTKAYGFKEVDGDMQFVEVEQNSEYDFEDKTNCAIIDYDGFSGLRNGLWGSIGQFQKALEQFKADGKTNLIIDLRNNGGGYMDILVEVASHLVDVEDGSKVDISVVKDKNDNTQIYASPKTNYQSYNFSSITFLANASSASASEALMGAVLDYDEHNRVNVVLEPYEQSGVKYYRSYGKGIMQTTFENFLTGEAIKLTTAKIFWPKSGISIHGVGITTALNDSLYSSKPKIHNQSENGCIHDALSFSK